MDAVYRCMGYIENYHHSCSFWMMTCMGYLENHGWRGYMKTIKCCVFYGWHVLDIFAAVVYKLLHCFKTRDWSPQNFCLHWSESHHNCPYQCSCRSFFKNFIPMMFELQGRGFSKICVVLLETFCENNFYLFIIKKGFSIQNTGLISFCWKINFLIIYF